MSYQWVRPKMPASAVHCAIGVVDGGTVAVCWDATARRVWRLDYKAKTSSVGVLVSPRWVRTTQFRPSDER